MQAFKTPIFPKASTLWLAYEQIKRDFRFKEAQGAKKIIGRIFLVLIMLVAIWGGGQPLYLFLKENEIAPENLHYLAGRNLLFGFLALFFMSLMSSFLYITDRGDLDLLLSSPIKPIKIISSRLIANSWRTFLLFLFFATMFILYSAIRYSPTYFSYIPTIIGLAILEAGVTFGIAQILLSRLGLKRGRNLVQILGFGGIFGGVFLTNSRKFDGANNDYNKIILHDNFPIEIQNLIKWLGSSLMGNWGAGLLIMAIGVLIFGLIVKISGENFAKDVAKLSGQSDGGENRATLNLKGFGTGRNFNLIKKEYRSLFRDPVTIAQLAAPLAGLLPLIFILIQSGKEDIDALNYITPPLIVFLSATVSSSLAWMIVSVEEAGDLLHSSPTSARKIYIIKALCAFFPAFIEIVILSIMMGYFSPKAGLYGFGFAILANLSAIMVEFSNPKPTKTPTIMQKPDRSMVSIIFGIAVIIMWAIAASIAIFSPIFALLPVAIALGLLAWAVWKTTPQKTNYAKMIWSVK